MTAKVAGFRDGEARDRFLALYDRAVEELWPVPSEEIDVPTGLGTTRVRRSGSGSGCPLLLVHGNSGTSVGWWDPAGTVERVRPRFLASMAWTIVKVAVRGPDAMREFGQRLTPGVELPELHGELMTTGAKGFRQALPMPRKLSDEDLRRLATPTLLSMAADSEVHDAGRAAVRARRLLPDAEVGVVEGAQHGLPLTHRERTVTDVLAFVDRHEAGRRAR